MGVKGIAAMIKVMPDYIRGAAIDPMHQMFGGCAKKVLQLQISTKKAHQNFSVSANVNTINSRLLSIIPPLHLPRVPRSLDFLA